MLKQLVSGLFILAFVVQTFSKPFILLDYYTNTAAYAKNCINKSRPKMHCNGQCQMMKKMREEEKKEQKENDRKADSKVEVFSSGTSIYITASPEISLQKRVYFNITAEKPVLMPRSFFHPPNV